jgi:hypothetical protein
MAGWAAIAACTVMLGAALALFLCQDDIARAHRWARTRLSPAPPVTEGPAIEDLARSLRRVRAQVLAPAPGTPMARRRGTTAAYEDLLLRAAHALGVEDTLSTVPEGTDREAERLRLEHLLREAGLSLD